MQKIQVAALRSGLTATARLSPSQLDQLAAVKLTLKLLSGPHSFRRVTAANVYILLFFFCNFVTYIIKVVLDVLKQKSVMTLREIGEVQREMYGLRLFSKLSEVLNSSCDCSFLYWCVKSSLCVVITVIRFVMHSGADLFSLNFSVLFPRM
jgi:hypothetical protein